MVAGLTPGELERNEERSAEFEELLQDVGQEGGPGGDWRDRMRLVGLDLRCASPCVSTEIQGNIGLGGEWKERSG